MVAPLGNPEALRHAQRLSESKELHDHATLFTPLEDEDLSLDTEMREDGCLRAVESE